MKDLFNWSIEAIRREPSMSWIDERREEWTPILASKLKFLLDGRAFIVFCDDEREWFDDYVVSKINNHTNQRPLLPFFSLKCLYPNFKNIKTKEEMELVDDMLNIAFSNGIVYFYIGRGNDSYAQIAKRKEDSYMWLINEHAQNSFYINGKDDWLDVKLIQLFTLFDKSVNAALFNEVVL